MLTAAANHSLELFAAKYMVNRNHAAQVEKLALIMLDGLAGNHDLTPDDVELLRTACLVHDVGLFINERGHHKIGRLLIKKDALLDELDASLRLDLAELTRYHRKDVPESKFPPRMLQLLALLRTADALDYHRQGTAMIVGCDVDERSINLRVENYVLPEGDHWTDKTGLCKKAFGKKLQLLT